MITLTIGAGTAGLAAARKLAQARERVTVLEACERVGGRVYTNGTLPSSPIEVGADVISGADAPT